MKNQINYLKLDIKNGPLQIRKGLMDDSISFNVSLDIGLPLLVDGGVVSG